MWVRCSAFARSITIAAAWDFPAHFGMNKDAFDDCMGDLPAAKRGYLTEIVDPAALLDQSPGELSWFIDSISFYAGEYAPARQFGVLLLAPRATVAPTVQAWTAAGADVELDRLMHLWAMNRGVLLTPFHNMALFSPHHTAADVDCHTDVFAAAVDALVR